MTINISLNNLLNLGRGMNWLTIAANATAAHSRHLMSLCLLSRGLQ